MISGVSSNEVGRYGGSVAFADYCPYLQVIQCQGYYRQRKSVMNNETIFLLQAPNNDKNKFLMAKFEF